MQRIRRHDIFIFFKMFDLFTMLLCFASGTYLSYIIHVNHISFHAFLAMRIKLINILLFLPFPLIWFSIFSRFKLYHSPISSNVTTEMLAALKAVTVGSLILFAFKFILDISLFTYTFLCIFWTFALITTFASRLTFRISLKRLRRRGIGLRQLLIVGTNQRAITCAAQIESDPALGYVICGFVENGWSNNHAFRQSKYSIVTDFSMFPDFITKNVVDEVMICLPFKSCYKIISDIVEVCKNQGIIVTFPTNFFDIELAKYIPEPLGNESTTIAITTGNMSNRSELIIKRSIDVLISLVALFFLSPLMLLTALLIKCTTSGPVFFTQNRVGINKRLFILYKFRTMVINAEEKLKEIEHLNEVSGAAFKMTNDPRITTVGKYLRKLSIDELPQFYNVLKGDMSLVGPRPLPVRDFDKFSKDWHRRRFSVRPGITCLWQIGGRSNTTFEQWMLLDMEYIDHWSLNLDLKILMKTIPAVIKGAGAV